MKLGENYLKSTISKALREKAPHLTSVEHKCYNGVTQDSARGSNFLESL